MRLFSYVVSRDYGFAPNPFCGICTLATCKPKIRKTAVVGDWVIGTGSKAQCREGLLVFVMCVSEAITFNEYWTDPQFRRKRPNLTGSMKQAYGDNIYCKDKDGRWHQQDSHHSYLGGKWNPHNIQRDTSADRVLIGEEYIYWGRNGPKIPERFRDFDGEDICKTGPGHKCTFPTGLVEEFIQWIRSIDVHGYQGDPMDWSQ